MKNDITTTACAPAAAYVAASVAATGVWTISGRTAHLALGTAEFKGTTVSARALKARLDAVAAAAQPNALFPITDVVLMGGGSGIRTWSPPV